jgi:hypothetical protein
MEKIVLNAETNDAITWPKQCPACGAELGADQEAKCEVEVKKGMKASFSRLAPKSISVMICDKCSRKIKRAERLANFCWGLAGFTFLAAIFVHRPQSQQEMMGAGGLFWLGAILGWLGQRRQKRLVGMRIVRLSRDTWAFRFRNRAFATTFSEQNTSLKSEA